MFNFNNRGQSQIDTEFEKTVYVTDAQSKDLLFQLLKSAVLVVSSSNI